MLLLGGAADIAAPFVDQGIEILWPFTVEIHLDARDGMHETEGLRMESLPRAELETVLDESLVGR